MKEELPAEAGPEDNNITSNHPTEEIDHDLKDNSENEMLITSRYLFYLSFVLG
jgi:hypothetical protein